MLPPAEIPIRLPQVTSFEPGERGSWCPGEVLKLEGDAEMRVAWVKESDPPSQLVSLDRVRPAPPAPPPGWAASLKQGALADLYYLDAWWEVELESRTGILWKVRSAHRRHVAQWHMARGGAWRVTRYLIHVCTRYVTRYTW